ncbi:uncharacterized protein EV420DRAFT_1683089 [Desarmillaria tabescens]|uniref:Heterokaryon incompatibility domain-containing protein n=1 Tax=Armillaria tabescens TaxID=1929756 RepID=A0AA39KFR3_ARMTA|nr:uncharacterized protein EV420DRAFT_1683089 [Desarmillaria tabescens]KAK0457933.1 hypothetical protein EV420DRAFT_1683089 [Desarmillaria tabescens]
MIRKRSYSTSFPDVTRKGLQSRKGPIPERTSELDENPNTIQRSVVEQPEHGSSSEDVGHVLEATPELSLPSHPVPSTMEEQSSSNTLDYRSDTSSANKSDVVRPWPLKVIDLWRRPEDISLPDVTISAFTEAGLEESSITVPKQWAASWINSTPYLERHIPWTHHHSPPFLRLEECIANQYDFGMAYSRLHRIWYTDDWSTIQAQICGWEEADREERRKALAGNRIVDPRLPPRRVWDLYSNRVVPSWYTCMDESIRPISHAWVDEKDRDAVWTPINGYEWPVPIPKDSNLNLVRIEMLNLDEEYAWLDVLCLRQVGGPGEAIRSEEWKLDVPTIGSVYSDNLVVIYLSGLGRPLSLKEGDLDSDRSWFRRAWTLQEVGDDRVFARDSSDGPQHAKPVDNKGNYETELLTRFHRQLKSIDNMLIYEALEGMQNRVSTNPVDKVAGLAFLMDSDWIPAYYESQSLEEAWTALVNSMDMEGRGKLFLSSLEPGNTSAKWRPSWDQVITKPRFDGFYTEIQIVRDEEMNEDRCHVEFIEKGLVRGLAAVEGGDRRGELIVRDKSGIEHGFKIIAAHEYPIPEDTYTLILGYNYSPTDSHFYCVIGRRQEKRFEKVSVLTILDKGEWDRLQALRIVKKC